MKQTRNLLTFLMVLIFSGAMLQGLSQGTFTLRGKVLDENGTAIVGASVTVKSSKVTTITDEKGEFTLQNVAPKSIIVISFIGYENFETSVSSASNLNVSLKPSASTLDNVVVNALGFESKKDKLGYATTRISSEALGNSGEAGLIQSMAGKSSGLRVSRTSGDPGAGSQIVIRGQSTITRSTDPLIVVDGVPINGSARGESSGGQIVQQSRLDDISPDDIANVQILKGASAAALWGTRAANGVIIITTKKGTAGAKPTINFRSTVSFDEVSQFYSLQDTYGQGNNGVWQANAIRTWGDRIANRSGAADVFNTNGANFLGNTGNTIFPITQKNSRETFNDKNFRDVFGWGHYLDNSLSMSHADSK